VATNTQLQLKSRSTASWAPTSLTATGGKHKQVHRAGLADLEADKYKGCNASAHGRLGRLLCLGQAPRGGDWS
jgi:hypothetical protein